MELHLRVLCEAWIILAPQPQTMGVIQYTGLLDVSVLEVFSFKITLCSVSSSAPPKMMSKCSPRVGAEFSASLQAVGTMRQSMGWGYITHTFQPLALWCCKEPATRHMGSFGTVLGPALPLSQP